MLLDRANFEAWLEGMEHYELVGERATPQKCPLATYAKDKLKESGLSLNLVKVTDRLIYETTDLNLTSVNLPKWAKDFICVVDGYMYEDFTEGAINVTAKEALEVLNVIE